MTKGLKLLIGGLASAVVVLAVALGVSLASDHGNDAHRASSGNGYMGMMQAMGNMDSDQMLARMKDILGPDGYQKMLDHMAQHRQGQASGSPSIDGMMHQMMDGMMQQMPDDTNHHMPMMGH
jgi:hypothetical protein